MEGTVKEHMKKKHTGPRSKAQFRFSNNLADVCKTACKLCGKVLPLQRMRTHTKDKHGLGITDYKTNFNQVSAGHILRKPPRKKESLEFISSDLLRLRGKGVP